MAELRKMTILALFGILFLTPSIFSSPAPRNYVSDAIRFVKREQWGARPPQKVSPLNLPVPFVIIHHTYIPDACFSVAQCSAYMRSMQNYHQLDLGWGDIGYNFAVGSDGVVYEGRGWEAVGAHASGYNSRSIGIVLIGDWVSKVPPQIQLDAAKRLIREGVRLGYIREEYDLIGHRQVIATECPGQALFEEISTWDRFRPM